MTNEQYFWHNVDEHWLNRELALQGIWDVEDGKTTKTLQDWLELFGEPVGVFYGSIYVWRYTEEGITSIYAESSIYANTWQPVEGFNTVEEAIEYTLNQEALAAEENHVASYVGFPFRFPPYYDRKADALKLESLGFTQLPDGNGGDDDYIVVDVKERTWIYGENGDDVLYPNKMRQFVSELGPLPLSKLARLS